MRPTHGAPLFALILAFLAVSCGDAGPGGGQGGSQDKQDEDIQPLLVRPAQPVVRDMDRTLEITGEVQALRKATIAPRISGVRILEVQKDVGDLVKPDDQLARLEDHDLIHAEREADVSKREARVQVSEADFARKELEVQLRAQILVVAQKKKSVDRLKAQEAGGAAAGMELDAAQDEYDREKGAKERLDIQIEKAKVAYELAQLASEKADLMHRKALRELRYARVTAPFAGVISERNANVGQMVMGAQESLYAIFDPSSLIVEAHVPQRDVRDMRRGLHVTITAEALPGRSLRGVVSLVSPVVEQDTGTIMVRITPANPSDLKPGLFVSGRIVLETRRDTLAIPRKAVAYERERPFVYIIEGQPGADGDGMPRRVRRIFFREGLADSDLVEFLPLDQEASHQLDSESNIVLVGMDRLRDGDPVRLSGAASEVNDTVTTASTQEGG